MKKALKQFFRGICLVSIIFGSCFVKAQFKEVLAVSAALGGVAGLVTFRELNHSLALKMLRIVNQELGNGVFFHHEKVWRFQQNKNAVVIEEGSRYLYDELESICDNFKNKEARLSAIQKKCALNYEESEQLLSLYHKYKLFNVLKHMATGTGALGFLATSILFNSSSMRR